MRPKVKTSTFVVNLLLTLKILINHEALRYTKDTKKNFKSIMRTQKTKQAG